MSSTQQKTWVTSDTFLFSDFNTEFANIYSELNSGTSVSIANGSITEVKLANGASPAVYFAELFEDGAVISGGLAYLSKSSLDVTITAGTAYVLQTSTAPDKLVRIEFAATQTFTVLDNTTNYLDLGSDGVIDVTQSATPATDHTRLLEVIASGGSISGTPTDKADRSFLTDIVGASVPTKVSWVTTSTSTITVHANTRFTDTTNTKTFEITGDIVVDIAGSVGALALDQGSEAGNTWYALVGIGDSAGVNDPSALLVTAGNYSGSIVLPTGYDMYRRLGWIRNDGSSNFLLGRFTDYRYLYEEDQVVLSTGASASFAAVSCASFVPPTSRRCRIVDWGPSGDRFTRVTGDGATTGNRVFRSADEMNTFHQWVNSSQSYDYNTSAGSANHDVQSYDDNLERDE